MSEEKALAPKSHLPSRAEAERADELLEWS